MYKKLIEESEVIEQFEYHEIYAKENLDDLVQYIDNWLLIKVGVKNLS